MPRKAQPHSRTKMVSARYSKAEYLAVKSYAKSLGIGMSTFVHRCVINELKLNNVPTTLPSEDPNQLKIETD